MQFVTLQARRDLQGMFGQAALRASWPGFIWNRVLPAYPVALPHDELAIDPIENLFKVQNVARTSTGAYSRGEGKANFVFVDCSETGFEERVDYAKQNEFRVIFDIEEKAVERCMDVILRAQEYAVATALMNTGTFTNAAAANLWSDPTNATPIADVKARISAIEVATGLAPNALALSNTLFRQMVDCDEIQEKFKYTRGPEDIDKAALAEALGFDAGAEIIVAGAIKNTANPGQAFSGAKMWDTTKAMVARICSPENSLESNVGLGRTFYWSEDGPGPMGMVEEYEEPQTRSKWVRARAQWDPHIIYSAAGQLITGCA